MVSFADICKIFAFDLQGTGSIEIEFALKGHPCYGNCWMGKMPDRTDKSKDLFWFGLTYDGSESYAFDSFETFISADVFDGKTLQEVWPQVVLRSIDDCSLAYRLPYYLG